MGRYTTESCPHCNAVIRGWHSNQGTLKIACPFIRCPNCGAILTEDNKIEYVMFEAWDYIKWFSPTFIGGIFLSAVAAAAVATLVGPRLLPSPREGSLIGSPLFFACWATIYILFIALSFRKFMKEKRESLERTRDPRYLETLLQAGLLTPDQHKRAREYYASGK